MIRKTILSLITMLLVSSVNAQGKVTIDADSAIFNRLQHRINARRYGKVAGYKIIIYSGTSKTVAMNVRSRFRNKFSNYPSPDLIWDEPRYKVLGGFFFNKFNAQGLFYELERANFPTVIMINKKFRLPALPSNFNFED